MIFHPLRILRRVRKLSFIDSVAIDATYHIIELICILVQICRKTVLMYLDLTLRRIFCPPLVSLRVLLLAANPSLSHLNPNLTLKIQASHLSKFILLANLPWSSSLLKVSLYLKACLRTVCSQRVKITTILCFHSSLFPCN